MDEKTREIIYPTPERIAEYNLFVLAVIEAKKGDKAEVFDS